jgi:hypothetical protein
MQATTKKLERLLQKHNIGYSVNGSALSGSQYFTISHPADDSREIEVRVSNHDQRPSYRRAFFIEISVGGGNGGGLPFDQAAGHIMGWLGLAAEWAADADARQTRHEAAQKAADTRAANRRALVNALADRLAAMGDALPSLRRGDWNAARDAMLAGESLNLHDTEMRRIVDLAIARYDASGRPKKPAPTSAEKAAKAAARAAAEEQRLASLAARQAADEEANRKRLARRAREARKKAAKMAAEGEKSCETK